ncbi:hypothetical protein N431DRAFT_87585 [Stipitochalara longipes BDJ]|nr:hypothetical protein N431DRAFT_87585 [Stipitochalara longipes BDJ]
MRGCSLALFAASLAPRGSAASQQPPPLISPAPACLASGPSCATPEQTTKRLPTRASAPAPGFGPQSSFIHAHNPPCSARVLSHGEPALPAFSSRTTMWSLPLPFRTRPTCNINDMRPSN